MQREDRTQGLLNVGTMLYPMSPALLLVLVSQTGLLRSLPIVTHWLRGTAGTRGGTGRARDEGKIRTESECYIEPYHTLARAVGNPGVVDEAGQSQCGEGLEQERGVGKVICAGPNGACHGSPDTWIPFSHESTLYSIFHNHLLTVLRA